MTRCNHIIGRAADERGPRPVQCPNPGTIMVQVRIGWTWFYCEDHAYQHLPEHLRKEHR